MRLSTSEELADFLAGKKVCVLGGAGFIGAALVDRLVQYDSHVTVIDGLVPSTGGDIAKLEPYMHKIAFYPRRLEECTELRDLMSASDLVVDSVGYTRHQQAFETPLFDMELNLLSHLQLINVLKELPGANVVFLGGRGQYGSKISADLVVETTCQIPSDVQGISKLAAEGIFRVYAERYGFNAISLRMTNCFGEGQLCSGKDIGFLGSLIRTFLRGGTYQVYGRLNRVVNLIYVWDAVDAILKVSLKQPRGFDALNVAGDAIELKTLLELLISITGAGSYQVVATPRHYREFVGTSDATFCENKLIDLIGAYQRTPLEKALRNTVAYFESRGMNDLEV